MSVSVSPPEDASLSRKQTGLAALLASLSALGPFSIDAYLPSMGAIQQSLQTTPYSLQMTLTAYMVPFAIMTLWHGAISDAVGRRTVVLWGMALFAISSIGCAFAWDIGTLLFFRALQGATAGAGMVVGRAIVRDRFQGAQAQRVMSQVSMTFAIAPAVAPVVGGWLQEVFGWRSIFLFLVLYSTLIWFLCRAILPETLPLENRRSLQPGYLLRSYARTLTSLPFLGVCLAGTFSFAGIFVYVASAPVFLMRHLGVSATGFLWLFGPLTTGMALGSWLSGRFAGRVRPEGTLARAFGLMAVATVGNLLFHEFHAPVLPWSVAPLFFYSIGMSLGFPTLTILALDQFPEQRGMAASCQSFIQTGGAALVAVLAPLVWDSIRWLAMTELGVLTVAISCVVLYRFTAPRKVIVPAVAPAASW